jgi:hypothetical protein
MDSAEYLVSLIKEEEPKVPDIVLLKKNDDDGIYRRHEVSDVTNIKRRLLYIV